MPVVTGDYVKSEENVENPWKLWMSIIANPFKGYQGLRDETKILLPLLVLILMVLLTPLLIQPITDSQAYKEAVLKVQYAAIEKQQGSPLSEEMKETYREQLSSSSVQTISKVSMFVSSLLIFLVMLLGFSLVLFIISKIMGYSTRFSLFFKILVFASILTVFQNLLTNLITLTGDYETTLRTVRSATDLQYALASPISLAVFFDPGQLGKIPYFFLDTLTGIFTWLFYIFIYAGLTISAKISKNRALIMTIIAGVLAVGIQTLLMMQI